MKKEKIALIINIIILVLEVIGFGNTIINNHKIAIEYYTNDSNLIALISSLLFIIFYNKNKGFVKDLRFVSTSCLTVTLLVVMFILCPMYDFNYKQLMFNGNFLIFHTLCPILSIVSYKFFEDKSNKTYLCILATAIYSVILITLNILNIVSGPYPFLKITEQSVLASIIWGTIILIGSFCIGLVLNKKGAK